MVFLTQTLSALVLGKEIFKLVSLGAVITASGCYSQALSSPSRSLPSQSRPSLQAPTMNKSVKFESLDVGHSPLEEGFQPEPKAIVFRNQQEWAKFWASSSFLDMNLQKRPAPAVNFDKQMVIALTSGSRPTGGFSVRVDRIAPVQNQLGNRWVIHYSEIIPDKNCLLTQQPTTPAVFVLTEKSNVTVELRGQKITSTCSK